jgi:hypothetical protein
MSAGGCQARLKAEAIRKAPRSAKSTARCRGKGFARSRRGQPGFINGIGKRGVRFEAARGIGAAR